MGLTPTTRSHDLVCVAWRGDVGAERKHVRKFFAEVHRHTAHVWRTRLEVVDRDNQATFGVGRPRELSTRQTLERFRGSLALVIGTRGQRFGAPTGRAKSATEEEFHWARQSHWIRGFR